MRIIDNVEYYRIGEVSKKIDRSPTTIKNWYEWAEQNGELDKLPKVVRHGGKDMRYYKADEFHLLVKFKESVKYGTMSEFNESKWGSRAIMSKRTQPIQLD